MVGGCVLPASRGREHAFLNPVGRAAPALAGGAITGPTPAPARTSAGTAPGPRRQRRSAHSQAPEPSIAGAPAVARRATTVLSGHAWP